MRSLPRHSRTPHALPPPPSQALYPLNYLISGGVARSAPPPPPGTLAPILTAFRSRAGAPGGVLDRIKVELDTVEGAWGVLNFTGDIAAWSFTDVVATTPADEVSGGGQGRGRRRAQRAGRQGAGGRRRSAGGRQWLGMRRGVPLDRRLALRAPPRPTAPRRLLPAQAAGTPESHIVRFAGGGGTRTWSFWVDLPPWEGLRIDLYVKHLAGTGATRAVLEKLPEWVSAAAVTTWQSSRLV